MDKKFGEEFEVNGVWYRVEQATNCCVGCWFDFPQGGCNKEIKDFGRCSCTTRKDCNSIIFKKLDKPTTKKFFTETKMAGGFIHKDIVVAFDHANATKITTEKAILLCAELFPTISVESLKLVWDNDTAAKMAYSNILKELFTINVVAIDDVISGRDDSLSKENILFVLRNVSAG